MGGKKTKNSVFSTYPKLIIKIPILVFFFWRAGRGVWQIIYCQFNFFFIVKDLGSLEIPCNKYAVFRSYTVQVCTSVHRIIDIVMVFFFWTIVLRSYTAPPILQKEGKIYSPSSSAYNQKNFLSDFFFIQCLPHSLNLSFFSFRSGI